MLTRRHLLGVALTEAAFAQRAAVNATAPPDTVWINSNEYPEGPPKSALEAMSKVIGESNRYHYQEFRSFYEKVARSLGFESSHVLVGAGSSEIIHCAIDAFTSPSRPLILSTPTYELAGEIAAALGRRVVALPMTSKHAADVKKMASEAAQAGGGLIYICNPNNPTASITTKSDIAWLVENLPANTVMMLDEAYIHFTDSPEVESGLRYVREGKNVIVARTFSKIYGMAGLRIGLACAKPDYIRSMAPFRDNVVNIVGARAVMAALAEGEPLIAERRSRIGRVRADLCGWLREKGFAYIEPHANFMMIDARREVRGILPKMLEQGVAVGRPFPPMNNWMRVTIGTEREMEKFRKAFAAVTA
jgi:histidinol-phosphate aminotransferase